MKKYFIVTLSAEPEIIGQEPGVNQVIIGSKTQNTDDGFEYLKKCLGSNYYWEIKDSIYSLKFKKQHGTLLPRAIRTNFMHYSPYLGCPFLVSEKIMDILSNHNLDNNITIPVNVQIKEESAEYFLLFMESTSDEKIDFSQTTFYAGLQHSKKEIIQFSSSQERKIHREKTSSLASFESVKFNKLFNHNLDVFMLGSDVFVSEELKIQLEEENASSGASIRPAFGEVIWTKIQI
jgi:hypothetical protein